MIKRNLQTLIQSYLFQKKAIILFGARQTGKTTLVKDLVKPYKDQCLFLNGDETDTSEVFNHVNSTKLAPIISKYKIVVIDEAQRIPNIGIVLKIIYDNFPNIQLIATGSSSFELANKMNEPMTGRKLDFHLHPLSFGELVDHHGLIEEKRLLHHRLVYGCYPDIVQNISHEKRFLASLASSYLYKDLLMLESIKKPVLLEKILKALAIQMGNEVSYNELAQLLSADKNTIEKYIDLLEKTFIIFKINGYSKNIRNEIKRSRKIYFYDNGIRNAILGNYQPIDSRTDLGALWENYFISERVKVLANTIPETKHYFWRTTQQQEIDLIEEKGDDLLGIELKWNLKKKISFPKTFTNAYPNAICKVVSPINMEELLLEPNLRAKEI
jgi:predicted AAA+ superfamily ATPase